MIKKQNNICQFLTFFLSPLRGPSVTLEKDFSDLLVNLLLSALGFS